MRSGSESEVGNGPSSPRLFTEQARLAALRAYDVVGRADLEHLDKVAQLAADRFERPMAAISFVEETTLWFGGMVGLPGRRAPRVGSLCDVALRHDGPFTVADAAAAPRFSAHPLVSGPAGVRAYAAAPLLDDEGLPLGTVCVFGREPDELPAEQLDELTTLARLTLASAGDPSPGARRGAGPRAGLARRPHRGRRWPSRSDRARRRRWQPGRESGLAAGGRAVLDRRIRVAPAGRRRGGAGGPGARRAGAGPGRPGRRRARLFRPDRAPDDPGASPRRSASER